MDRHEVARTLASRRHVALTRQQGGLRPGRSRDVPSAALVSKCVVAVVVRPAIEDDVPGIVQAYLESWRGGYEGLMPAREIEMQAERRRDHDWLSAIVPRHRTSRSR